ncbi:glucosamine-6-phosphate deaminase [Shewanella sp. MBTL60-007]|uniref:glucosamine-6-phosphate deaminase n=1 Tax=Shewanella sp. MBTL60-007 TaxID=2815911 RepID=UPI001BBF01AD|nr:glucosamine-6-phosphate deaminase [Shewanella sp. MBTL60-007]GIU15212.1 glucosamine-6-phosphate deaminase [Shewanella sp. MBTL60-007]
MQIIIHDNAQQVAINAALWVQTLIKSKEQPVLGLATGSTPIKLYKELVEQYRAGLYSFANTTTFNLDEYHNIDANNPQSYRSFMCNHLFNQVDIDHNNTYFPTCTQAQNPREQGKRYEDQIKQAGGIDLQILGIGANGHIGFNEPSSSLTSRTRIKTLTQQTLADNSRLFSKNEIQPTTAMTMGIATIMEARCALLIATGSNKAKAVKDMVTGPVSASCPASILQMHENAIILLDKEAASTLENQSYYIWADKQNAQLNENFGRDIGWI